MCIDILPVSKCTTHVPEEDRRGIWSSETGITDSCDLSCGCGDQIQQVSLTEPPRQPPHPAFLMMVQVLCLLRKHFAKWTISPDSEIESFGFTVEHRHRQPNTHAHVYIPSWSCFSGNTGNIHHRHANDGLFRQGGGWEQQLELHFFFFFIKNGLKQV